MTEFEQQKYDRALRFATEKHSGQFRRGGMPYITHPVAVAEYVRDWGYDLEHQIIGLFHDLLEDTDATEAEILELGGETVLHAVKLLTKEDGYIMEDYVSAIKADPYARVVKAADRLHNLRCAVVTTEEFKRRYILESVDWYLDLSPEIPKAVKELVNSLETPLHELSLKYKILEEKEL